MAKIKYPTRWLTYRQRVRQDVNETFAKNPNAADYLDEDFVAKIAASTRQLEQSSLKLIILQTSVLGFLVLGFSSPDASLTFLGVPLKNVSGIREVLLAVSATLTVMIASMLASREAGYTLISAINEKTTGQEILPYGKFAEPAPFYLNTYIPHEYNRWMFARINPKIYLGGMAGMILIMFGILMVASVAVQWLIISDVWRNPHLGGWSRIVLLYVALSYAVSLLLTIRMYAPFPFEDRSSLLAQRDPTST